MEVVAPQIEKNLAVYEKEFIDLKHLPKHVAIIMDGNRRWAKKRSLNPKMGHLKGVDVLDDIVEFSSHIGIKILTVFGFSTENWNRSDEEVNTLIDLLDRFFKIKTKRMIQEGVQLETIGDLSKFPPHLQKTIQESKEKTKRGHKIKLVLALNYGARDEITRAIKKIASDIEEKKICKEHLTEKIVSSYLDTSGYIDPDLLIRTSGVCRLSNFMLWQLSYTEVYITNTPWPDFTKKDLLEAIKVYQNRDRRFGG